MSDLTSTQEPKTTVYSANSDVHHSTGLVSGIVREMWQYRALVWTLFVRDLRSQHRRSILGYLWLIIPPLTTTLVWFFLNSQRIVRVETEIPYPLFVLIGTTVWSSFVGVISKPFSAFEAGKSVYTRLKVPPEIFVFSGILHSVFEVVIRLGFLMLVFVLFRFVPASTAILFPIPLAALFLFSIAVGIALIPLSSLYGDVSRAVTSFIGIFMYLTPVVYPFPGTGNLLGKVMYLNPATPCVAWFRDCLTNGSFEWAPYALCVLGISAVLTVVSIVMLRIATPHLITRMGL